LNLEIGVLTIKNRICREIRIGTPLSLVELKSFMASIWTHGQSDQCNLLFSLA